MAVLSEIHFYRGKLKIHILLNVLIAFLYTIVYDYIVRNYLFVQFGYMLNYEYHPMKGVEFALYSFLCVFPIVFYKGFRYLASIISIFSYILVYIPFLHTFFVANYPSEKVIPFITVFVIIQCVFFLTDKLQIGKKIYPTKKTISFRQFEWFTLLVMFLIIIPNFGKMHMVNFTSSEGSEMLYDLREENAFNSYWGGWAKYVFLPILMVCYLKGNEYLKFILAFGGMMLIFMLDMQKITFIIPFVITILFFLYKYHQRLFINHFHIIIFLSLMILPVSMILADNELYDAVSSILIMRTQCVGGRQLASYFNFFEIGNHPYTYFSHVNFVNMLTGMYPYSTPLGYVISGTDTNSNANFFLMDGIAGCGLLGCVIVSMVFVVFKAILNTVGNNIDKGFCAIILVFAIANMMNVSLFTALLTGGFIVFYIVCRFVDLSVLKNNVV